MRYYPSFFQKVQSGQFFGDKKPAGRVTVEPNWLLNSTGASYGNSVRGPYKWFQDVANTGEEWEVPNIKSISWDRSEGQDIAQCTITLYNMWHESNTATPELAGQLGKPGYFWPKRGLEVNRWGQLGGTGSFRKDGFWDPNFSWQNKLVQYGMIRTYEGYGGHSTETAFKSINQNLTDENVLLTGTWLIDTVTAGSNGEMVLNCKDMGKMLLEQICFPPVIPNSLYPLDYYPAGKSAFDSVFGPRPKAGVSPGSQGEVKSKYVHSSADAANGGVYDIDIYGHKGSYANDGNWQTSTISEAHPLPESATVFWDFDVLQDISTLSIKAWAGGYECYISVMRDNAWLPGETIPGLTEPYVAKINIPHAIPDNQEPVVHVQFPASMGTTFYAQRVKISMRNLYYSGLPDGFDYYRAGIRDLIFYREGAKVDPYSPDFATVPWTFSMCAHPTRGYWVCDDAGNVYGFGDAADYDSTAFGQVPLAARSGHSDNQSIAMCAHPDGKGYWVLDRQGHVYPYGSAAFYGEHEVPWPGSDKWGDEGLAAWDIACTHTGNGYWLILGDGEIHGFGDANPTYAVLPATDVTTFMTALQPKYYYQRHGTAIAGHPTKMGCWATTGSGEVYAFGEAQQFGQLDQRVYNRGMADEFRLTKTEFTRSIEPTVSGNGYWVAFGSGKIAAFGDAVGQGPTNIYPQDNPGLEVVIDETNITDWSFYRALVWDMARDPDGTGFWVLVADGNVGSYSAEFWGNPGYQGLTGYRWHEGNFSGDWSDIMKDLLLWSGFTFYNPAIGSGKPEVFGSIESTGIKTDTSVGAEKFDKRPILDIIKELCEVVAYRFSIQEDGGVKIASPNIWRAGNFDVDGARINVLPGTYTRVDLDNVDGIPFIPLIDEEIDMFDYSTTLSSESMRSEIIIGTDSPDPKNPSATGFVRHTPRSGTEMVAPGIPLLRNIPKVGMWISQLFQNPEEAKLMAELISLNAWFAERTSSTTVVANPCYSIGDQVKFAERNTAEYNIHYITGINSNNDLDSGVWTQNLTTFWLGDSDNWVITASNTYAPVAGSHYVEISERVDRWQQYTDRGLQKGSQAAGSIASQQTFTGAFDTDTTTLATGQWVFRATLTIADRMASVPVFVDTLTTPLGTGISMEVYNGSTLLMNKALDGVGQTTYLSALGLDGQLTSYTVLFKGTPSSTGNGVLKVTIPRSETLNLIVTDTLLVTN